MLAKNDQYKINVYYECIKMTEYQYILSLESPANVLLILICVVLTLKFEASIFLYMVYSTFNEMVVIPFTIHK